MSDLVLRAMTKDDLPAFYRHQLDPEANRMAAFTVYGEDSGFSNARGEIVEEFLLKLTS
ncbi:hypothetical protein [Sphaerisporangium sp. TRM90804]|uniref:hypothetical protein n=1 Tax=Sphaerisporangium sp. TRM90804 TaxID=3031113 RepID=UPI0024474EF5|nr:hypothetical protein [Sphaerisporangium sp. TRM90804]MDH2425588.1 hypothetical protein [Sphaerisporangium sp. TRM90804]